MDTSNDKSAQAKKILRQQLIADRQAMPDRAARATMLQQVMRIWLVGRTDTVIGLSLIHISEPTRPY
mgnify:CR=1 FL=1